MEWAWKKSHFVLLSSEFFGVFAPGADFTGNSQADLAQCQVGRTVNETSAAEYAGENCASARNLPPAEAAWNGESWNTAAQRDHADQETKNNKRLCRLDRECARQRYVDTIRKTLCRDSHDHPTGPLVATLDMLTKGEGAS